MIALSSDCLLFQTTDGEALPFSAEMISIELMGDSSKQLDPDFVRQASKAVFHYFRNEMGRETVTVAEFASALEKVLRSFGYRVYSADAETETEAAREAALESKEAAFDAADLRQLASETAGGCELFFFPKLRDVVRSRLQQAPRIIRFEGLRACVKQLAGVRRWTVRCEGLQEHILEFLRECLCAEAPERECALVVR